jgi:hypothetical protein
VRVETENHAADSKQMDAVVTNAAATAREKRDAEIKEQYALEKKGQDAVTNVGHIFALACVDSVYSAASKLEATRVYRFRTGSSGPPTNSDLAQVSKLVSFAKAGLGWKRRGIELVTHLVKLSEGMPRRYNAVLTVLVRINKRHKGEMPLIAEVDEWLEEAQQPKPRKERKSKSAKTTETSSDNASTDGTTSSSRPMSASDVVREMDRLIEFFDLPEYLRDRWVAVRNFVEKEASAEITPEVNGPTADESSADDASNVLPANGPAANEPAAEFTPGVNGPTANDPPATSEPVADKPTAAAPQADFTPGVKEPTAADAPAADTQADAAPPAGSSADDPLAIPGFLNRRKSRPQRAGS